MSKETKEEITKHLNRFKAGRIKDLCAMLSNRILYNPDFRFAAEIEEPGIETPSDNDARLIIEDDTGRRPDIERADILSPGDIQLISRLDEFEKGKRATKAERIDVISSVLCSDALLEGFILLTDVPDDVTEAVALMFGCQERFAAILQDPVYQNRKTFKDRLNDYINAAVNLYGCLHVDELFELIRGYERKWFQNGGRTNLYTRSTGAYRKTFIFTSEWLSPFTLEQSADVCASGVGVTLDGFLIHGCFLNDLSEEMGMFTDEIERLGHLPDEDDFSDFIDDVSTDMPYRILFETARKKEMYKPKRIEFLSYVNEESLYDRKTLAKVENFLWNKYLDVFETRAEVLEEEREKEDGNLPDFSDEPISADEVLEDFMMMLEDIVGNDADCLEHDPIDTINSLSELLDDFGIILNGEDDLQELIGYVMALENSTRRWLNHGYTPDELMMLHPAQPGKMPTIVPRSSHAAAMLAEGRKDIEKMGFTVDLDSNADEIPVFAMPEGVGGQVKRAVKKVYPNDPCPCGSGKKYKKCCGRARNK